MKKNELLITDFGTTPDFPKWEGKIADYWDEQQIFQKSLQQTQNGEPWIFYDGPPFATGLPHYGHLVASTTKDVFPRFQTMLGRYVKRVWGWDCHGLPVENLVEKEFNLKNRHEIEEYGIGEFCENCRGKVMTYAEEWKKTIRRLGRFVDMDNDYKTMDVGYMENVWGVFKQLWEKNLIYKDYKPMHICPRCSTPLSNFEVTQGYKEITDISVYVTFLLKEVSDLNLQKPTAMLAWTTTPWTLPGNFLLAVNPQMEYSVVAVEGETSELIVASERLQEVMEGKNFEVKMTLLGSDLVGREYEPCFPYFAETKNAFRVVEADFVTAEDGTGIVHIAPAYGENDFALGKREGLPIIHHVDLAGRFTKAVTDFAGMEVRKMVGEKEAQPADIEVIKYLAAAGKLWRKQKVQHSYPHCWRCDYPLLNYATESYFVRVSELKEQLLANNEKINWQPEHLKEGRFGKWLAGARDWAISRNRFWGTPLPLWVSDEGDFLCVGSVAELEELSGQKIADLHKHFVDKIVIEKDEKKYRRVSEVLDCWFESGSMPYASAKNFPADFISEGQDQTRGWFYTLHVLATALKNEPAYKNVLVNGIILAEDGKKMSKKLHNYPEPEKIFDEYGADALRLYLMTSPVMKMESLNFDEKEVGRLRRQVEVILWNVYVFWRQAGGELEENRNGFPRFNELSLLDQNLDWEKSHLITEMTESLQKYEVVKAGRLLIDFIDELSTFYVRLSRERLKNNAYTRQILGETLLTLSKLMAPIMPFFAELLYQNVEGKLTSVHLEKWPHENLEQVKKDANEQIGILKKLLEVGRSARKLTGIKVRQPLAKVVFVTRLEINVGEEVEQILCHELNVKEIIFENKSEKTSDEIEAKFDLELTTELIEEGKARELMREIADERKRRGLQATDDFTYAVTTIPAGWQTEIEKKTKTKLELK